MLNSKMNAIISEVNEELAEREELINVIALALLTRKNLFVLGEPGQAKSQAIDLFRSHISDAKQFEILMSKGIDQEQLFGRLDLASIIPGHISNSRLKNDAKYCEMRSELSKRMETAQTDADYVELVTLQGNMQRHKSALGMIFEGKPEILTEDKIPESHICFLDEIFKSNDGVLNSLLKALNERVYTNEGVTVKIPVISFFSASNEIPNFNNPEEKSLRALYDRFDFKVCTRYVSEKANRMSILKKKQGNFKPSSFTSISLAELEEMQNAVKTVIVPDSINEIAENILCELRRRDISVTDRIYFNFTPIVQAAAFLKGRDTVQPEDMIALTNYLWNKPDEYAVVQETIKRLTENPLGDKLDSIMAKAYTLRDNFNNATDKAPALLVLRDGLLGLFDEAEKLKKGLVDGDAALSSIDSAITNLEDISKNAHGQTGFTYLPFNELKALQKIQA